MPQLQPRVNVVSKVSRGCGSKIQPTGMQSRAEELLRSAGITVSNIYNSQIAIDTDCVPSRVESDGPGMLVTQCLSFLEVAALSSVERRTGFSTTWRSCESAKCSRAKCGAIVISGIDSLVNMFLAERRTPKQAVLERGNAEPSQPAPIQAMHMGSLRIALVIFLSILILFSLSLFLYWQLRDRMF